MSDLEDKDLKLIRQIMVNDKAMAMQERTSILKA